MPCLDLEVALHKGGEAVVAWGRKAGVIIWPKDPAGAQYTTAPAKYAKGKVLVRPTRDGSGLKGRAHRLVGYLRGRWTNRERGYVLTASKVAKLARLWTDGYDATPGGLPPWSKRRPELVSPTARGDSSRADIDS